MTDYYRDIAVDHDWLHDDDALAHGFAITAPQSQTCFSYWISLLPITLGELRERLELAGLREVGTDFGQTADHYVVTAVAA